MNRHGPSLPSSQYPASSGAYILELNVREEIALRVGRLGQLLFQPGRYLYVGSAYGPGGIAARVTRHLKRKGRRLHWHIDYLSTAVDVDRVWVVPGGNECEIVSSLLSHQGTSTPFAGFGSSDCRRCLAHLLVSPPQQAVLELLSNEAELACNHGHKHRDAQLLP